MISYNADGSVTITSESDPSNTQRLPPGSTNAQVDAAAAIVLANDRIPAPQSVTRFQAKAALLNAGLLSQVETAIAGASALARLAWAEAATFERQSPTIAEMAAALKLSDDQVDDLFRQASGITA